MALEDTPEDLGELQEIEGKTYFEQEWVNHPDHYMGKGLEVIDIVEAFDLNFNLGNVVKYLLRAGKKFQHKEDLLKAKWYLEREIHRVNN